MIGHKLQIYYKVFSWIVGGNQRGKKGWVTAGNCHGPCGGNAGKCAGAIWFLNKGQADAGKRITRERQCFINAEFLFM